MVLWESRYYIRSQITAVLQQQTKDWENRTSEIFAYSKLITTLNAKYNTERYRFDNDVYRVAAALREEIKVDASVGSGVGFNPVDRVSSLASMENLASVVERSYMTRDIFNIPKELMNKRAFPPTVFVTDNGGMSSKGATLWGGYVQTHPVRNGSFSGSIKDLRYRVVTLESLRRAIAALEEKLLTLGKVGDLEQRIEVVRVQSIEASDFKDTFEKEMSLLAENFLTEEESREFAALRDLYDLGFAATYRTSAFSKERTKTSGRMPDAQSTAFKDLSVERVSPHQTASATPADLEPIRR